MTDDDLSNRLNSIKQKTKTAADLKGGGFWVADAADERRVYDDLYAGRLHWLAAHRHALAGLDALKAGDFPSAQTHAWIATDCYIAALESRIRPSDAAPLARPSKKRGRPQKNKSSRDFSSR